MSKDTTDGTASLRELAQVLAEDLSIDGDLPAAMWESIKTRDLPSDHALIQELVEILGSGHRTRREEIHERRDLESADRSDRISLETVAPALGSVVAVELRERFASWPDRPWGRPWIGRDHVIGTAEVTTELVLHRGMCRGPCPAYTLRIATDGTAAFEGHACVDLPGRHETTIPLGSYAELAAAAAYLHRMLPHRPIRDRLRSTCLSSEGVQITVGGEPVQAVDDDVIRILGSLMDGAASELDWGIGDRIPAELVLPAEGPPRQRHWAQRLRTY